MLKQDGNVIQLNKSFTLTPQQKNKLKNLNEKGVQAYLMSLMGIPFKDNQFSRELKYYKIDGSDPLFLKKRNHTLHLQRETMDASASKNHKPLVNTVKNRWVGVEIECNIEGIGDECENCCGRGETTCYNCDGDGYVYAEDSNGHEYRCDCNVCDGDGEIECDECDGSSRHEELRRKLRQAGIGNCSVREDGSLHGDGGVEICMLFDASKGFKKLEKLLKVLNDLGAEVDKYCGLHIHLNQFNTTQHEAMMLGNKMAKFLPVISKFVHEARRENEFCKLQASDRERYSAINLTAFAKHGTIEYRLHSGSTNFEKIKNWIELLIHLEDYCKNNTMTKKFKRLKYFFQKTKMPKHLVEYYTMRYKKFNSDLDHDLKDKIYTVQETDLTNRIVTIAMQLAENIDNQIMEHISEEIEQAA